MQANTRWYQKTKHLLCEYKVLIAVSKVQYKEEFLWWILRNSLKLTFFSQNQNHITLFYHPEVKYSEAWGLDEVLYFHEDRALQIISAFHKSEHAPLAISFIFTIILKDHRQHTPSQLQTSLEFQKIPSWRWCFHASI